MPRPWPDPLLKRVASFAQSPAKSLQPMQSPLPAESMHACAPAAGIFQSWFESEALQFASNKVGPVKRPPQPEWQECRITGLGRAFTFSDQSPTTLWVQFHQRGSDLG